MGCCNSKSGAKPPDPKPPKNRNSQGQTAPAVTPQIHAVGAAATAVTTTSTTMPPSDSSRWAAAYPAGVVTLPQYMTQTEYVLDASDTKCVTVSAIGSKEAGKSYVLLNASSNDPAEQRPDLGGGEASLGLRLDSAAHIVWMDSKLSHGPTAARDGNMRDKICIRFSRVVLLVVNNVDNVVVAMDQIREHITSSQECFVIHNYLEGSVPRVPTDVINNTVAALRKGATGYGELMTETTPVLYLRHNKNDRWRHFFLSRDDHESNRAVYNHMRFVIGSYLPNARPIDELCRAVNTVATEMAECLVEQPVREPLLRAVRDRLQIQPSLAVATGKRTLAEVDTELRARGIEGYRVVPHTLTKERCHTTFPFDDDAYVLRFDIAVARGAAERIEQSVRAQLQWGEGIDLSKQRTGQTVIVRVVGPTAQLLQTDLQVDEYAVGGGDAEPFIEVDIADGGTTLRVAVYFAPGSG